MSIKIGDVDLLLQGVNNEFKIEKLEKILELILNKNSVLNITREEITKVHNEAIKALQQKYPSMGITWKAKKEVKHDE